MCATLVKGFAMFDTVERKRHHTIIDGGGTWSHADNPNCRQRRQAENDVALGGMRNPFRASGAIPGWHGVGARVRRELLQVVGVHQQHLSEVINTLGCDGNAAARMDVVHEARASVARAVGFGATELPVNIDSK